MNNPIQIRLREVFEFEGFELYIRSMQRFPDDPDMVNVVTNMTFERVSRLTTRPNGEPLLRMEKTQAKQLMDDLWNAGIRPTNFRGDNNGEIVAYKDHITDLRNIMTKLFERYTG